MKVALVSFGHSDSAIPMAKALSEIVDIDLIFTFPMDMRKNNVVNFENIEVKIGLQNDEKCKKAFSSEVKEYLNDKLKLKLYIYKSLKFKSFANWNNSAKFAKILKKYDLIHFNGKNLNIFQLRFFLPFKKFIYTIHDLENHTGERANNILARKFNHLIIKSKSHVVIQNKQDFIWVNEKYPNNKKTSHFIPFGKLEIYKQYKTENTSLEDCNVLLFGRISPYKGIEYFVDAVHLLKSDFPNIKAIIAGGGDFYFDISTIQNDKAFTIYNRFLHSEELVALIKQCEIVVCPYIDATQSGVAMTAFTFNKPVIATDTGGFKDVIINGINGYLVPTRNSKAIYEKVKLLMQNKELLTQMEQNIENQGYQGEFAWKNIAQSYKSLYQMALKKDYNS